MEVKKTMKILCSLNNLMFVGKCQNAVMDYLISSPSKGENHKLLISVNILSLQTKEQTDYLNLHT